MENNYKVTRTILLFLLLTTSFAYDLNAQSKPKRDSSKDRSIIIAKQKENARKKAGKPVQKERRVASKYRKPEVILTPKQASFLRVNQLSHINKTVNSFGGEDLYEVNTDGQNWDVYALPTWCHIRKYSNSFLISYDQNPSHDDRSDWFKVKSDNHEVKINIIQSGSPLNIDAFFNYGILQHNYFHYNKLGYRDDCLRIETKVTIKGAKDQKCFIVAFIYDDKMNKIKATYNYSDYAFASSQDVYTAVEVIPTTDDAQSFYLVLYLPNNSMRLLKKKNTLWCQLLVYCDKTSSFISNSHYIMSFKAKKKRGKVTTKKL